MIHKVTQRFSVYAFAEEDMDHGASGISGSVVRHLILGTVMLLT